MIRGISLRFKRRMALRYNKVNRSTPGYQKAQTIGILVKDINEHKGVLQKVIRELEKEGKKVHILSYQRDRKNDTEKFDYDVITRKDINWRGNFKSYAIKKFIKTDFDYLFSLNTSSFLLFENILARCSAKCRIGIFNESKKDYYEMMIQAGERDSLSSLAEQMIFYTRLIK